MKSTSKFLKKLDIFLLILFPLLSVSLSLNFKVNFLTSILLFYGLPSLWFSLRTKNQVLKTFIFALFISIPFGLIADFIATIDKAWFITNTVFTFRIFGVVPIEDLIWGFFLIYCTVIVYEHFLDKGKHELMDKRMKYIMWPLLSALSLFLITLFTKPGILNLKFAYLYLGIFFFLLPTVSFLSFFPKLISKYIKIALYFFILSFLFEITAIQLNQWTFPGSNFIGWIQLFGFRFPIEEFFVYFLLCSISTLSYYEFFDDDRK